MVRVGHAEHLGTEQRVSHGIRELLWSSNLDVLRFRSDFDLHLSSSPRVCVLHYLGNGL